MTVAISISNRSRWAMYFGTRLYCRMNQMIQTFTVLFRI